MEIVKILLKMETIEVNSRDTTGRTPQSWAAGNGNVRVVKLLLRSDPVIHDHVDNNPRTPLWWAVEGLLLSRAPGRVRNPDDQIPPGEAWDATIGLLLAMAQLESDID